MGAPWEIFSVVAVTMLFGGSFCYYMSQKQKKYFADEAAAATAANRAFLVVLPMSSHPTSDTLPVYSVAVLAPAVTILPSALPLPPPSSTASSSLPSLSSPLASSLSSTVQGSLSGGTGGPGGPGVESHLPPPPSYQPIAVPR